MSAKITNSGSRRSIWIDAQFGDAEVVILSKPKISYDCYACGY